MENHNLPEDIDALVERFEKMVESQQYVYMDSDDYMYIAGHYVQIDDLDMMQEAIRVAMTMHPDSLELRNHYLLLLLDYGLKEEALDFLDEYDVAEYNYEYFLTKIEVFLSVDNYDEALSLTQTVLESPAPSTFDMYADLGNVYVLYNYPLEAISYLDKAYELKADDEEVLIDLSVAHDQLGDYAKSIEYINKLIDKNPYSLDAWINLARVYALNGEQGKALEALSFAETIDELPPTGLLLKADMLRILQCYDEALQVLDECTTKLYPPAETYDLMQSLRVDIYMQCGQSQEALQVLQEWENSPQEVDSADNYQFTEKKVATLLQLERFAEAEEHLTQAVKNALFPDYYNLLWYEVYFLSGQYHKAEELTDQVLENTPDDCEWWDKKVVLLYLKRNYAEALKWVAKMEEIGMPTAFRKALIYGEMGDLERFAPLLPELEMKYLQGLLELLLPPYSSIEQDLDRSALMAELLMVVQAKEKRKD